MSVAEVPLGWEVPFARASPDLADIEKRLKQCKHYFPRHENIYRVFDYLRPEEIIAVVLGQDPYPGVDDAGEPLANGIPFALNRGVAPTSSLVNVYDDLKSSVPGFAPPRHGNLTRWLRQGVFLLNSRLTVPAQRGERPHDFWAGFLISVVEHIQDVNPQVIFVLWGNVAKDLVRERLRNSTVCFECCHPSGRNGKNFVGMGTLQAINDELKSRGRPTIDWRLPEKW